MKFKELRKRRTGVDFSNYKYERKVLNILGLEIIIDVVFELNKNINGRV